MASTAGNSQQRQSKFGKNLFKARIVATGAELETPTSDQVLPPSGLSPGDYDYNPFYLGNQGASATAGSQALRPPSPVICDNFNPFFDPQASQAKMATAAAVEDVDTKSSTRRNMISEMLQELQRLSTKASNPSPASGGSKELTPAGVSFGTGGSGGGVSSHRDEPDFATFSVKVGDDGGMACGSDEPMIGSSVAFGGGVGDDSIGAKDVDNSSGYATFSVKAGDDGGLGGSGHAVSGTACGSDEPMSKSVSTGAASGGDDLEADGSFGIQASEAAIRVETKLLRFLNDPALTEFRFEGRLQPADRRAVRWFAKDRGLFFKEVALRSHERAYVVKKPYTMAKEQQLKHREAQRAEARRLLQEASALKLSPKPEPSKEGGGACVGSASFGLKVGGGGGSSSATIACSDACMETDAPEEPQPMGSRARSMAPRRDNWCQTIPEENFLCYVCQEEVPLVIKTVHIASCLANQRQQLRQDRAEADRELEALARRQAALRRHKRPGDRRKLALRQAIEEEKARLADKLTEMGQRQAMLHGGSQQQQQQQQQRLAKVRPFESVHSNDIQRLIAEARQLDKFCCVRDCGGRLTASTAEVGVVDACDACGGRFCEQHASGPAHGCIKSRGGNVGSSNGGSSSVPTKFERNKLRQGLRDRLAMMAERRK